MLILEDLISHVIVLANIFFIGVALPFFMVLKLDIAGNLMLVQIQQIFLAAVSAVGSHFFQYVPKCFPVFFQNRDQCIVICPVIAHITVNDKNSFLPQSARYRPALTDLLTYALPSFA